MLSYENRAVVLLTFAKFCDDDPLLNFSYGETVNYIGATVQGKMCDKNYAGVVAVVWHVLIS
jgi:hypothetical protein